ncbi:MAG: exopolysaccharide biosynthesis protein [Parvularculaceae bacterium]
MRENAPPNAAPSMTGATRFLRDILDELERGAPADIDADDPQATLGDVLDRLDERAFGLLLLLLALPCCLPFVYVLPQIVALPMLALAAQLAAGRVHPWLPKRLRARQFSIPAFRRTVERGAKYGGWIERLARPRLRPVTGRFGARLAGALMLIPAASILVPLPSTNTIPGIGVAVAALGLIERDGVLVVLGLLIGFIWVALLVVLGAEAVYLLKSWIAGWL